MPGIPAPRDELLRQEQELGRLESSWQQRVTAYERQNGFLKGAVENLVKAEADAARTVLPPHLKSSQEDVLIECYRKNARTPLKCSREVRDFAESLSVNML